MGTALGIASFVQGLVVGEERSAACFCVEGKEGKEVMRMGADWGDFVVFRTSFEMQWL